MATITKITVNNTTYDIGAEAPDVAFQPSAHNGILDHQTNVQDALDIVDGFASVVVSGSYNDLSNTPSLATVATSGSYNDLSNKPTIPTITYGTADPSGGSDGDIYIKYEV